ncbi:NUDIX domain-containing protein [Paenibacillus sp. FSL R10-2734]|uniref:NUDIX hydrolase n=1 Tax=Paenibacillus sp. FSL R10-2734 TaxID=2954691 RepID=UPI0030DA2DF0
MNEHNQHIVVCVKGIILHQGKILLVKRAANDSIGAGTWECAGGKIEFGEKLDTALMREIEEETSLIITIGKLLYATSFLTDPNRQIILLTYLCTVQENKVHLSLEHSDYHWCTKDELYRLLPHGVRADFEQNGVFALKELL